MKSSTLIFIVSVMAVSTCLAWMVYDATYNRPHDFSDYWVTYLKYGSTQSYGDWTIIGLARGSGILYELGTLSMPDGIRVVGHYELEIGAHYIIILGQSVFGLEIIAGSEPNAYKVISITRVNWR
jgi:hypothetical protein